MPTLPGIEYLGKGFNLLGENGIQPKMSDTRPLLILELKGSYTIAGTEYQISDGVAVSAIDSFESNKFECSSVIETSEKYSASFGVEGKFGGFSAKLESAFSSSTKESTKTNIVMIQQNFSGYDVGINVQDSELRFTQQFTDALNGTIDPGALFKNYGTHMIKGIQLGGKLTAIYSSKTNKKESMKDFSIKAEAKYKGMGASVSSKAGYSQSSANTKEQEDINDYLRVFGGAPEYQIALENNKSPETFKAWAASVGLRPTYACITAVAPIWDLCSNDDRKKQLEDAYKFQLTTNAIRKLQLFKLTSDQMTDRLDASLTVRDGYKILSGGAKVNTVTDNRFNPPDAGLLLTASYPQNTKSWQATAKSHIVGSTGTMEISVISVYDPFDLLDVNILQTTSGSAQLPTAKIGVPNGYVLTGGGAKANYTGYGNLLTASYPLEDGRTWFVKSKDHHVADPCTITAYAIGIKPKFSSIRFETKIWQNTSPSAKKPEISISEDAGYQLVGGGAIANYKIGSMLTASYTNDGESCFVKSQNHHVADPCTITASAIGLKVV